MRAFAIAAWPADCYVASEGACLMDADSKTVIFGKDAYSAYYPASITKVLTALVTLENCDNLSEQVTFSYDAVHIEEENSTIIGASEGDRLSVLDCLYSLLFQSANEVANALAEHIGAKHPELKEDGMNDRDVFVRMMNQKAEELGCTGSHFNNPSGLTDEDHYTTAYDMCLIMAAAIKNEEFLDIERHTYWTHAPIARYPDANDPWNTVYPKHLMLKKNSSQYYEGTIAGKTGYTLNAGNTLVTAVERDGMTLVTCVLNAHANHYNDTRRLMDFGFDNFSSIKVSDYDDINDSIKNDFSIGGTTLINAYTMGIDPDTKVTIPKSGSFVEVEKKLNITESGENGQVGADLVYMYGDRTVGVAELRLVSIGDNDSILASAGSDPLLADILGVTAADEENTSNDSDAAETEAAGSVAETADDADLTTEDPAETEAGSLAGEMNDGDPARSAESDASASDTQAAAALSSGSTEQAGTPTPQAAAAVSDSADAQNEGSSLVTVVKWIAFAGIMFAALFTAVKLLGGRRRAARRRAKRRSDLKRREGIKYRSQSDGGSDSRRLRKIKRKRKR